MANDETPEAYKRLLKARGDEIRRARESRSLSQSDLAGLAGTSQQTVDRLERGAVEHSRAYPKIRKVLGMDMYGYDSWPFPEDGGSDPLPSGAIPESVRREFEAQDLVIHSGRIPVVANKNGAAVLIDAIPKVFPYEYVQGANAVMITDTDMEPVLRPGDIVVLHPHFPAQVGNEVGYGRNGQVYVRTLAGETDTHWIVKTWNPEETQEINKQKIANLDVALTRIMKTR